MLLQQTVQMEASSVAIAVCHAGKRLMMVQHKVSSVYW